MNGWAASGKILIQTHPPSVGKELKLSSRMLEKQDFYWGAALVRLLDDSRCTSLTKRETGYVVNGDAFIALKYTTKSRTPWRFTFGEDEFGRLIGAAGCYRSAVIALVCGGDGICAISWTEIDSILGHQSGWVSVKRDFHKQYGVAGSKASLDRKISVRDWPSILFASRE